jgi:hypothetical protein
MLGLALFALPVFAAAFPPSVTVEAEETVATCLPPNNGAGPTWDFGAPMIVRHGDRVFVSAMETSPTLGPLCNTRPRIFVRDRTTGWHLFWQAPDFLEREPCPIVAVGDSLFVSTNQLRTVNQTRSGPCDPGVVRLSLSGPPAPHAEVPVFVPGATFSQHSYRGVCADPATGSFLVCHIDDSTGAEDYVLSRRLPSGEWVPRGRLHFPIRACYPQVCLEDTTAEVLAIGDIVEPVAEWRAYKFAQTKREWDYVFRRLFFAEAMDLRGQGFGTPLEIDNLDATAGWMLNLDLWVDHDLRSHVLYVKSTCQSPQLRDKFFPGLKITRSLEYAVVHHGAVIERHTLAIGGEGLKSEEPLGTARFHVLPDGRLLVLYETTDWNVSPARRVWRLMQVSPEITSSVEVPLKQGMSQFFTANERGGSKPSSTIDIFGIGDDGQTLRYAQLHVSP